MEKDAVLWSSNNLNQSGMIRTYVSNPPKIDYGKSCTIPDQNYTVKQLFERFARGLPVQASRQQPVFLGEENDVDMEKIKNLSIMDKADLSDELYDRAQDLDQAINDAQAQRSEAKKEAEKVEAKPEPGQQAPEAPKA